MTPRYAPLPHLGCIEVRGPAAAAFLHAQLSRALDPPEPGKAPLAAWHDARGRVRALFRVVRLAERWLLFTERDVLESTLARLRMFVLRAAVTLNATDDWRLAAVVGADDTWLAAQGVPAPSGTETLVTVGALHWIHSGEGLWHAIGAAQALDACTRSLERVQPELAALAEIRLGIPTISPPLVEKFVPQMLNLDLLGAVAFDKGCYPGQEVIARVRNLGSVKRRMRRYAAASSAVPASGREVVNAEGIAVGEVVRAAPGVELLAVVDHAAADGAFFCAGAPLRELPLPYAIPRD